MRGYSLIECLCSVAIVALLISGIAITTKRMSAILGGVSDSLEERVAIIKTGATIQAALASLERSHISGLVTTTAGDNPRTPSGAPHPVAGLSGTSRPRSGSTVLSTVEVDPRFRGRIVRSAFSQDTVTIDICGAPMKPTPDQFRSHLVIGLAGPCQITGSANQISANCFQISGRAVAGLIAPSCAPSSLLEYLPVIREFSLHIDRSGELRLISHVGNRILENQPVVRGLRSFSVTPLAVSLYPDVFYRVTVSGSFARSHTFLFASALTREGFWNEVLL